MNTSVLMAAFDGRQPPPDLLERLPTRPPAGFTLFRHHNVASAAQVRTLTAALQAAAPPSARPLLLAADQEGGQLIGLGDDTTAFAGAMALGAAGDDDLAERVARATGREMRALGVNVNYAPVCDLATDPTNPSLGIRSFGDDPAQVARLVAATVRGLQAEGVAATAKHFPGGGELPVDPHHELPSVARTWAELAERELVPFRAALTAGARLVMTGHICLPKVTGDPARPASLAHEVVSDLLRREMGFDGLAITDALDMQALPQTEPGQADVVLGALRAGQDLLLGSPIAAALGRVERALERVGADTLDAAVLADSGRRLAAARSWLARFEQPPLEVVGCAEHRALASELAERSITLLRDEGGLLPLLLAADARVLVVMPQPADLTPADTSSYVAPALAAEFRRRHPATDEVVTGNAPTDAEVGGLRERAKTYDLVVVGTLSAGHQPAQAELARALLAAGRPTVTLALRTPWDLGAYPQATTHALSYGIQPASLAALVGALFGELPFRGRLPVELPGLYRRGHGS